MPRYKFEMVCPRCFKAAETTSDKYDRTPLNCGDCLYNDTEIVPFVIERVTVVDDEVE